jgi:aldehyde dehydrogenase (NAD+)
MGLSGQVCSTQTRTLVQREIYDDFLVEAARQLEDVRLGDPFDPRTTSAPIITPDAAQRAERLLGEKVSARRLARANAALAEGRRLMDSARERLDASADVRPTS